MLELVNHRFEWLVIFFRLLLNAHDNVAVHLNESAVTIPGEALIFRRFRDG